MSFCHYKEGDAIGSLVSKIVETFDGNISSDSVFLYENGRTAEYEFLRAIGCSKDDNVVVLGFTCNAVVNPVLWLGLVPRYVDIDPDTLSFDMDDLARKVDGRTRAIILQHTFGIPGPVREVLNVARSKGIFVLEDCAHALGGSIDGRKLGTFGDAAIVSFGIEKILSTRIGGALLLNNSSLKEKIKARYEELPYMSAWDIFLWLLNPLWWRILRRLGSKQMKAALFMRRLGFLNMGFSDGELLGRMPQKYPRKLGNALCKVVIEEFGELRENIEHRALISQIYEKGLSGCKLCDFPGKGDVSRVPYVRFPLLCVDEKTASAIESGLISKGYYVGDWYRSVVYPPAVSLKEMKYGEGMCPVAENVTRRIINLPTGRSITPDIARSIVQNFINYETGGNEKTV